MLALLLVAASVGLSNFAAAIAIGVAGVDARTRLRVGIVFGVFETAMPIVGLAIGAEVAGTLGHAARWVGAGLLITAGAYGLLPWLHRNPAPDTSLRNWRLLLTGFALSLDNLVVGFALGSYHAPVLVGALVIGGVSVAISLIGLEIGARVVGRRAGDRGEQLAGVVLMSVGVAIAAGKLS
jgi:manganese efflux pump family protein